MGEKLTDWQVTAHVVGKTTKKRPRQICDREPSGSCSDHQSRVKGATAAEGFLALFPSLEKSHKHPNSLIIL